MGYSKQKIADFGHKIADFEQKTADFRHKVVDLKQKIVDFRHDVIYLKRKTVDFRRKTADFRDRKPVQDRRLSISDTSQPTSDMTTADFR